MENSTSKTKSKGFLAEWLEKIQQESWQLELLISGLALYGVYSGADLIEEFNTFAKLNANTPQTSGIFGFAYGILFIGWRVFFFNLLIHVILRGLWIASIGLRYVSDDIDFKELNYAPKYTEYLQRKIGTYDEFIEKLEKLCSLIFAFTFLIFLLFVSITIFAFILAAPFMYKPNYSGMQAVVILIPLLIYFVLGLIVAIDFITLGGIKKIRDPWVVNLYSPIFKFYSFITLSFLYRPILYNFLDQKYTKRFLLLAIPYVIFLAGIDSSFSNYTNPYKDTTSNLEEQGLVIVDGRYMDLIEKNIEHLSESDRAEYLNDNVEYLMLSNYHVKNGKLSFFMRDNHMTELMTNINTKKPLFKNGLLFNLFFEHEEENEDIKNIKQEYLSRYVKLHKEYSKQKNVLPSNLELSERDSILQLVKDSINVIVDSLEVIKKDRISESKLNYNNDIFHRTVATVKVKIDSIDYTNDMSCKYFKDPFIGAEGVLCNLYEANLPKGNKIIELTRKAYSSRAVDSIRLTTTKIPVYFE